MLIRKKKEVPAVQPRTRPRRFVSCRSPRLGIALVRVRCGHVIRSRQVSKFGGVTVVILCALGYLAYTGVPDSKSYYVTIKELNGMGNEAYSKRLRVAGNVVPGSIKRTGTRVDFMLKENELTLPSPTPEPRPRPTPSRTIRKHSPMAASAAMASSTPSSCKPSAPPGMRPNKASPARLRPPKQPRECPSSILFPTKPSRPPPTKLSRPPLLS